MDAGDGSHGGRLTAPGSTPPTQEPARRRLPTGWIVGVAAVAAIGLVVPLPRAHRGWGIAMDLAHLGMGAALTVGGTWLAQRLGAGRNAAIAIGWVGASAFLGTFEALQGLTGRSPGIGDAIANALGGLIAAILLHDRTRPSCVAAGLVAMIGLGPPALTALDISRQARRLPVLSDFETRLEMTRWNSRTSRLERRASERPEGGHELVVHMRPGPWPGANLIEPYPDWRGYTTFSFRVHLDRADALQVCVTDRDHDETWEDRFNASYDLPAGWSEITIPIASIEAGPQRRRLRIERVDSICWFLHEATAPRTLRLDDVRLGR